MRRLLLWVSFVLLASTASAQQSGVFGTWLVWGILRHGRL